MSTKPANDLSSTERTSRRAEWEAFEFRVPAEGRVRVSNHSYGEDVAPEHRYVVSVNAGRVADCTCPHQQHRAPAGGCKHIRAVRNTEAVVIAASASEERR
jgi:hypothetical protein